MPFGVVESSFTLSFNATTHGRTDAGLGGVTLDGAEGQLSLTTDPNRGVNLRLVKYKVATDVAAHNIDRVVIRFSEMLSESNAAGSDEMGGALLLLMHADDKGDIVDCNIPLGEVNISSVIPFTISAFAEDGATIAGRILNISLIFAAS